MEAMNRMRQTNVMPCLSFDSSIFAFTVRGQHCCQAGRSQCIVTQKSLQIWCQMRLLSKSDSSLLRTALAIIRPEGWILVRCCKANFIICVNDLIAALGVTGISWQAPMYIWGQSTNSKSQTFFRGLEWWTAGRFHYVEESASTNFEDKILQYKWEI